MLSLFASWGKLSKSPGISCVWNCSLRRHSTQRTTRDHNDWKPWTAEEDRKLEKLVKQGFKLSRMVSEMDGRTYGAVHNRLRALDYGNVPEKKKYRAWTAKERALLAEKKQQGLTARQIVDDFPDRNYTSINAQYYRATFWPLTGPKRSQDFTDEQIQRVIDMRLKEAKTSIEVAEEFKCNPRAIEKLWSDQREAILSQEVRDSIARHRFWSPDEMTHLLELHRRGILCTRDIALQFPSKTLGAVMNKCVRERLKFPYTSLEGKDLGSQEDKSDAAFSHN
jgi:hypothetical protein